MAYQQKRLLYYGHLTDAARLLMQAYLPDQLCTFCLELKECCQCDPQRQEEKDGATP